MLSTHRYGAWLVAGSLGLLAACGGGGGGDGGPSSGQGPTSQNPPSGRSFYTYVTNDTTGQDTISIFSADSNIGELRPVASVNAGLNPAGVAVAGNRFVYVANHGVVGGDQGNVSGYAINASNGTLTPVAGSPFAAGRNPAGVTSDSQGRVLYVTNFEGASVSVFTIGASGALTPLATASTHYPSTVLNGTAPAAIAIAPSGRFAYTANKSRTNAPTVGRIGSGTVTVFRVETDGRLTAIQNVAAGIDPIHLAVSPDGRHLYVANNELPDDPTTAPVEQNTGDVTTFPINADGTLGTAFATDAGLLPQAVVVDPSGSAVYVATSGSNTVTSFARATNGTLTANGLLTVRSTPWAMAIEPSGRFLHIANASIDGGIATYLLEPGMAPRALPFTTSAHANSVASTAVLP